MNGSSDEQVSTNSPAVEIPGRLKVRHIASTTEGAMWMLEQLRELRDRHQSEVTAVVAGESGGLINLLRAENIPCNVESFSFGSLRTRLDMPRTVSRLTRFFLRERFDVIQTHHFFSMIIGRIATFLADVPVRLARLTGSFILQAPICRRIERDKGWMDTGLMLSCECSMQLYQSPGEKSERLTRVYYEPDEVKFSTEDAGLWGLRADNSVLTYLTFRLDVIEIYLPIYLPIHLARLRSIPYLLDARARPFLPGVRRPLRRSRAFLRKLVNHLTEE